MRDRDGLVADLMSSPTSAERRRIGQRCIIALNNMICSGRRRSVQRPTIRSWSRRRPRDRLPVETGIRSEIML
jgi:hypothetical protein